MNNYNKYCYRRDKTNYHPMFVMLFLMNLLPHEIVQQIPRSTRNDWRSRKLENYFGFTACAIYITHFNNVAFAHKYSFTRHTLATAIGIQKTILAITQTSVLYKKLLRTRAANIVEHITDLARKGFSVTQACKLFGIKKSWYHYHKHKISCPSNVLRTCFKLRPNQLTYKNQLDLKRWFVLPANIGKSLTHLYYKALNKGVVFCSKKTFNTCAHLLGYVKVFRKPKAKKKIGHRSTRIFEHIHVDTTYIPTLHEGVLKLAMVKDNYSKAILHYRITKANVTSTFITQALQETFDKHKLYERSQTIHIVSDGGAENKGDVLRWVGSISVPPCVRKITAKTEQYPYPNNMIEGSFNLLKHDFLKGQSITNYADLQQKAEAFIEHTLDRYFGELHGITPRQVLAGEIPDKHKFAEQIKQAVAERKEINKTFNGCTASNC